MSTQSQEWITAARVLRRSSFGATGEEIDALVASGTPSDYVDEMLTADFDKDPGVIATPVPDVDLPKKPKRSDEKAFDRWVDKANDRRRELVNWWIRRMAAAQYPTREKLTFLWHNHFATSEAKVRVPTMMARQNQTLREHCLGDFRTLAYELLTDAAMIKWLDGHKNVAGSPNENLSREFLELFALGHGGGYSEHDVREGARALTGWVLNDAGRAELVPQRHDEETKTVLGATTEMAADDFCDTVLQDPNSARFIASRLWQQLASDQPPSDDTVARLLEAYGPGRDLRALTAAILTDESFLGTAATMVTPPLDWAVGLVRGLRLNLDDDDQVWVIADSLKRLEQRPFYPPDVSGWPSGQAWLSSSAAIVRLRTASKLVQSGDLSRVDDAPESERIDAVGYMIGVGSWSDRSVTTLSPLRDSPPALIAAAVNTPEYLTS